MTITLATGPWAGAATTDQSGSGSAGEVCDEADGLIDRARPTEALALIDRLRYAQPSPLPSTGSGLLPAPDSPGARCARQRERAFAAIGIAQQLATFVEAARTLDATRAVLRDERARATARQPDLEAAAADAEAAGAADTAGQPDGADAVARVEKAVAAAREALAPALPLAERCLPLGAAAASALEAALGNDDPGAGATSAAAAVTEAARSCDEAVTIPAAAVERTEAEEQVQAWERVLNRHVKPWQGVLLATLVVSAALLVLARLLSRRIPHRLSSTAYTRTHRRLFRWLGVSGVLATAFFGVLAAAVSGPRVAGLAVLAILSAAAVAWADSGALRVNVTVTDDAGKEQQAKAGQIIALLDELGGAPPQGLLSPRGTDVTALKDAGLDSAPAHALAKIAWTVARLLEPRTPWHARVEVVSDDVHAVSVSRNGRPALAAQVDREVLRLHKTDGGVVPDLFRMSAAVVLCALHEAYHFPGLPRRVNWRSVGYHYVATTQLRQDAGQAEEYLARAVGLDADYRAARFALWSTRFRKATSAVDLTLYLRFLNPMCAELDEVSDPKDPDYALRLRAHLARAVAAINLAYARDPERRPPEDQGGEPDPATTPPLDLSDPFAEARHAVWTALHLSAENRVASNVPVAGLAAQMRQVLDALRPMVDGRLPSTTAGRGRDAQNTPLADYTWACTYASFALRQDRKARVAAALERLRAADSDPDLRAWRAKDPQLTWLTATDEYKTFYPATTTFAAQIAPFNLLDKLAALGIHDRDTLAAAAGRRRHRRRLADRLGTVPAVVERMLAATTPTTGGTP